MADPVIHYTFDTDGTNSGTSGSTDNTSGTISTTNKFIGAGSLETTNETRSSIPKFNFTSSYTKGITFSFWLKHDGSVTDSYYLYSCHPSSTGYEGGSWNQLDTLSYNHSGTYLQLFSTDPNGVQGSNSSNQTDPITSAETAPIFDGNWHHIAVSYGNATLNLSNQRIRETTVYIDNTIVCYADDWVGGFPDNQNSIVIIGETYMNTEGTYSKPWKGNYDDFRMYDYALANSQITDVYKSGLIDSGLNLVSLVNSGTLTIADFFTRGYTVAQLFAIGFTQADIDIGLTNIKIHTAFTIKDGAQNESAFATDAVYTPATFAAKLTTDLGYTVTAGGDLTTTDSTPYYRLYLQFANAVTLTNMPKYIFNIPFSDFSVKAGGQVNLRNVSLDAAMVIDTSYDTTSNSSTIPAGNYFINDFVSTIGTDLNFTLSYDEPNKRIEFVGLAQDISMNITSSDTTIFDTTVTEITQGANTLPFITYGQPDPTIKNYSDNGITPSEFISNGYTILQLLAGSVIPDWNFDTDANHFDQSYVKGFTDVSGSVVIRNDNKLITNGELSLGGNLIINPTPPIQPDTITTLIPNSEFSNTDSTIPINDVNVPANTEPAYVLSNVSITSLDQIEIVSASMDGSAITGPISAAVYKYPKVHNGAAVEGNWVIGIYDGGYTKSAKLVFTLNGTTPSIQQIGQCHYQGTDLTTSSADLISLFNDSNYNANYRETNYGYQVTGLTYRVTPAPVAQPQGSVSLVIDDMTLKSRLFMGEDITANGKVYVGGDLSVNGQFSGDFLNNSIPTSAIIPNPIDISGNVLSLDDISFNGPTVDVNVNLPLKITTTLIPDSDLTDNWTHNNTVYFQIPASAPLVLTGVSIDSLDQIGVASVVSMVGTNIGGSVPIIPNFYKYVTDANGPVTGNIWIFGSYHLSSATVGLTRAVMIEFTLNGTTPSVQQIKRAYNTAYNGTPMDYTTTSADLHELFNNSNIGTYSFDLNYSITGLTYQISKPQKLEVNQIEFNDGTTMTTHDDNILSGTFADSNVVFKDSTFTSVTCEGAVDADSKTTSDYRIKENVTELNETDTVDALVPIQYNNTLSGNHEFGLLAHELQEIYPDLVNGEKDGDEYQRVQYNGLIGVLVKEVQDIKQRLAILNNR